jgi:hypothetical protein
MSDTDAEIVVHTMDLPRTGAFTSWSTTWSRWE